MMRALNNSALLTLSLLLACGGKRGLPPVAEQLEDTGSSPDLVTPGLVAIEGGHYFLGEQDPFVIANFDGDGVEPQTIIPEASLQIDGYWIDRYPFPGVPGDDWFADGLNMQLVASLDGWLQDYGRRACTISELLLAAAGPDNHRYPYGDGTYQASACDEDDTNPAPIGNQPDCVSALGVRDFQVRSTWGKLDREMSSVLSETDQAEDFPGDHVYAVWGGTSRTDTFYAPNNFGFHTHDPLGEAYQDDGFRVCAGPKAPSKAQDAAYALWLEEVRTTGSYAGIFE
jgi:hypothetical protein